MASQGAVAKVSELLFMVFLLYNSSPLMVDKEVYILFMSCQTENLDDKILMAIQK